MESSRGNGRQAGSVNGSQSQAARFRAMMRADDLIVAPGSFNPLSARLVEQAGFSAVYMTGGGTAQGFGMPDVGLVTMTEMVNNASLICDAVNIPLISDADNAYGNVANVWRTVRAFEKAGVAAIHIEDQTFPKRCGNLRGKELVPIEEMVQKIRAALDARRSSDFTIVARCDAIIATGFEDAIKRGKAYVEAGADALFVETPRTREELETIAKTFAGTALMYNASPSGKNILVDAGELKKLGFKIMIVPISAILCAIKAMQDALAEIKRTGSAASVKDQGVSYADFHRLGGLNAVEELISRYDVSFEAPKI